MKWTMTAALALCLAGCASGFGDESPRMFGAMVGIVNHTDRYIYSASVDGAGGGNMSAYGAGGASICCARLPVVWHPGMMVNVFWNMPIGRTDVGKEKMVEVEKYDAPGDIYIHVFPGDQVRVIVTRYGGASTQHPIPAPVKPAGWKRKVE